MFRAYPGLKNLFKNFILPEILEVFRFLSYKITQSAIFWGKHRVGVSGESARLLQVWPGFDSRTQRHMWVEFVVGSLPCPEKFFSGYSGFLLSSKTNISKFQLDLESTYERVPESSLVLRG